MFGHTVVCYLKPPAWGVLTLRFARMEFSFRALERVGLTVLGLACTIQRESLCQTGTALSFLEWDNGKGTGDGLFEPVFVNPTYFYFLKEANHGYETE